MKKFLVFLVMMGVIFGVVGVFVFAQQGIEVIIPPNINVTITPTTITFGSVQPGTTDAPSTSGNVTFNPTGSNVNITIEVTNVTSGLFEQGLEFDNTIAKGQNYTIYCVLSGVICTYTTKGVVPTLTVPIGTPAGTKTGVITYTITAAP